MKRKAKQLEFKEDEVVAVYADGVIYYEQIVYAGWCRRERIFLTNGGHTSNLFNMRRQTKRERGDA